VPDPALPLSTARLRLREFVADDLEPLTLLCRDPRLRDHVPLESRALEAARRAGARLAGRRRARRRAFELAIELRRTGKLIGACDLALYGTRAADIGYLIGPRHWGHGYGTEVARALVALGFETLGLQRLSAVVAVENDRSRRVLERAGLVWEGLLRRHVRIRGRTWDCHVYALERRRWLSLRAACAAPAGRGS
jgi:RimJ/RimL family protein N-acetyltransferase